MNMTVGAARRPRRQPPAVPHGAGVRSNRRHRRARGGDLTALPGVGSERHPSGDRRSRRRPAGHRPERTQHAAAVRRGGPAGRGVTGDTPFRRSPRRHRGGHRSLGRDRRRRGRALRLDAVPPLRRPSRHAGRRPTRPGPRRAAAAVGQRGGGHRRRVCRPRRNRIAIPGPGRADARATPGGCSTSRAPPPRAWPRCSRSTTTAASACSSAARPAAFATAYPTLPPRACPAGSCRSLSAAAASASSSLVERTPVPPRKSRRGWGWLRKSWWEIDQP